MNRRLPGHWIFPACCLFYGLAVTVQAEGDKPAGKAAAKSDPAAIKLLVEELGADEFSVREAATERLAQIGLPAYKAVEDAVQHPDREVRYRAERVLARIRQSDLQRRLDAFQRGVELEDDYQLPGWARFKKSLGDNSNVRAVFVDLIKADAELLQALDTNPRSVTDIVGIRVQQYQQLQGQFRGSSVLQLNFGQIGALVFVAAQDDVTLNANQASMVLSYCRQSGLSDLVTNGSRGGVPRQMLAQLIIRSDDWAAYTALDLARQYNMKEGLIPAEKILKGGVRQGHVTCMAMSLVASMGDESHEPLLEKLLTDSTLVTQIQEKDKVMRKLEIRDAALATLIYLTKQELKDYFTIPSGQAVGDPRMVMTNVRVLGFTDEEERKAVLKKWQDWRAKNPSKAPVKEDKPEEKPAEKPAADKTTPADK
jgi:hypothetical protein